MSSDSPSAHGAGVGPTIAGISALTLVTRDMPRSLRFYEALGFTIRYGGDEASFTSLVAGADHLNLMTAPTGWRPVWWGRVIFHVADVDALHDRAVAAGLRPDGPPRDAEWGERYFHVRDPDGHELSFARPLD